jgi:hypothetical protein
MFSADIIPDWNYRKTAVFDMKNRKKNDSGIG